MLENHKIIITGAASGIGKAALKQCLYEGASVIACDLDHKALLTLKEEVNDPALHTYEVDVSHYNEVTSFFFHVASHHSDVTGLVNNAGIYLGKPILEYNMEDIDRVLAINVKGYIYFSQAFGKLIIQSKRRGVIINISSVSGIEGSSDAVYGCSKAAILGLTKSCAINFCPYIRVNAIAPGMVVTPMMEAIPEWRKTEYLSLELIKDPVLPEDVAHTITFLLSDKAKHYTGATFDINNGVYLR